MLRVDIKGGCVVETQNPAFCISCKHTETGIARHNELARGLGNVFAKRWKGARQIVHSWRIDASRQPLSRRSNKGTKLERIEKQLPSPQRHSCHLTPVKLHRQIESSSWRRQPYNLNLFFLPFVSDTYLLLVTLASCHLLTVRGKQFSMDYSDSVFLRTLLSVPSRRFLFFPACFTLIFYSYTCHW